MEELQARHRQEQRDLQNRVTQKKKQASKKTRKGVNDECDRLEAELREKQRAEIEALNGGGEAATNGESSAKPNIERQLEGLNLQGAQEDDPPQNENEESQSPTGTSPVSNSAATSIAGPETKKPNRQKARLARRAAEQEELARQAAAEATNLPDRKQAERDRMLAAMQQRHLQEKEIRADGHCLYSAVADQLTQLKMALNANDIENANTDTKGDYKTVRARAADYIEQHADDFAPFLEGPLSEYVHKVRDTGEWGGQLELAALAKTYGVDIHVLQDYDRVETIDCGGENGQRAPDDKKAMWLAYYKHGFGLGEHYNSLRKIP